MRTNTSATIFSKNDEIYTKIVIDKVFWEDRKAVNINRGLDNINSVMVYIPLGDYNFKVGDIIVKGTVSEQTITRKKTLDENYSNVYTITGIDLKDYGSKSMQHYEVSGK